MFKGVRVDGGSDMFLVRPLIGSQRGPCPAYTPESCMKLKAFGSDVHGVSDPQFSSKLKPSSQERSAPPTCPLLPPTLLTSPPSPNPSFPPNLQG